MAKDIVQTILGLLVVTSKNGIIYATQFVDDDDYASSTNDDLITEIKNYFKGKSILTSKCKMIGTEFQIKTWRQIKKIPYGETKTYSEIAEAIGHPNSCRAVANACGQNKIALFIPCHRVVGKKDLGGYKWGIGSKQWLLDMEKNNMDD